LNVALHGFENREDLGTVPMRGYLIPAVLALFGGVLIAPASATTLYEKFYVGPGTGPGYAGPYNGLNTVYDKTKGLATDLPTSGTNVTNSGGDTLGTQLNFTTGGASVTGQIQATSPYPANNTVWDDRSPNFAGLGTGILAQGTNTDQIGVPEILRINFGNLVKLDGVGTLFDSGHITFGTNFQTVAAVSALKDSIVFDVRVFNGISWGAWQDILFKDANNISLPALNLIGTMFEFEENTTKDANNNYVNPEFYVSALAYEQFTVSGNSSETPLPAALPLFATGLGAMGLLGWRRKRKAAAIAAA
jgi:hypothetical protein